METNVVCLATRKRGVQPAARHASIFDPPPPDDALHRKIARTACQIRALARTGGPASILNVMHKQIEAAMMDALRLERKLERIEARRLAKIRKRRRRAQSCARSEF